MKQDLSNIICISALTKPNTYFIIRYDNTEVEINLRSFAYFSSHTLYEFEKTFIKKYLHSKTKKYEQFNRQ